MQVHLIDRLDAFERLRPLWNAMHERDPHASVFMKWAWLRAWFEVTPYPWAVLGAREDEHWIGFLAISPRGFLAPYRIDTVREVHMGGDPGADYTGFVAQPEHAHAAVGAIARYLADQMSWDRLRFKEVDDPRLEDLLHALPREGLLVHESDGTCCPYIELPDTWEEYLRRCLGPESRKSLKRSLKRAEQECRVTWFDPTRPEEQVDVLVRLGAMRGQASDDVLQRTRHLYLRCAGEDFVSIVTLWCGDTPVAAQGLFLDWKSKSVGTYLSGFDPRFARLSPVKVLDAICIREAIGQKMRIFDFLRGAEPYKFHFGAKSRYTRNVACVRRGFSATARVAMTNLRDALRI